MDSKSSLNHRIILAWFALFLMVLEWGSYHLQILINLYDFSLRRFTPDYIWLASILLAPFIVGILITIGAHVPQYLKKIAEVLIPIALMIGIFVNLLFYLHFYRLGTPYLTPIPVDGMPQDLVGMYGELTPNVELWLRIVNIVLYLVCTPLLIIYVSEGKGIIQITPETNWAMMGFSVYMLLRWGSIGDTPFRFIIMGFVVAVLWLKPIGKIGQVAADSHPVWFQSDRIPFWGATACLGSWTFAQAAPSYTAQGLMFQSWIWVFNIITTIILAILISKGKWIKSVRIAVWFPLFFEIILILLILSSMIAGLLPFRWLLMALGMLCSGILLLLQPTIYALYQQRPKGKKAHNWHRFIQFCGRLILIIYLGLFVIYPFLASAFNPVTDLLAIILLGFSTLIMAGRLLYNALMIKKGKILAQLDGEKR